jgi:hypothetical protein
MPTFEYTKDMKLVEVSKETLQQHSEIIRISQDTNNPITDFQIEDMSIHELVEKYKYLLQVPLVGEGLFDHFSQMDE